MSTLNESGHAGNRRLIGNQCLSKITLAINAGSAATIKNTGAIVYAIGGVLYTKTALSAQSFAVTHGPFGAAVAAGPAAYVQPANTTVFYVVSLDASGNVAVSQGSYLGQTITFANDLSKVWTGNGAIPVEPDNFTAIGVVKIVTGATTFTPGTTALDAANVTATYYDVMVLPPSL